MSQGWTTARLGDLCEIYQPKTISKKMLVPNGKYPVYGANGQIGLYNEYNHEQSELLVTCRGATCGAVNVSPPKAWINGNAMVVRPRNDAFHRPFLRYMFQGAIDLSSVITGAAQPQITRTNLAPVTISFPESLAEQKRIVSILDEAFGAIERAKENAQKNLANARELFESYLNRVFTEKGEGWEETTVGELCVLKSGTTVKKSLEKSSGDTAYVKVADMNVAGNEVEIVTSSRFLNSDDIKNNAIFPSGTTIFPKRGGAIMTNKKRLTAIPICCDLNIMGVIPPEVLTPRFLYYFFVGIDMRELGSGATIPQINNYDIDPLAFSFPNYSTQNVIVESLEALENESKRLQSKYTQRLASLDELKQSILQKAFTGKLTAKSPELEAVG